MSSVCFTIAEDTIDTDAECEECEWSGELEMWVETGRYTGECPDCGADITVLLD